MENNEKKCNFPLKMQRGYSQLFELKYLDFTAGVVTDFEDVPVPIAHIISVIFHYDVAPKFALQLHDLVDIFKNFFHFATCLGVPCEGTEHYPESYAFPISPCVYERICEFLVAQSILHGCVVDFTDFTRRLDGYWDALIDLGVVKIGSDIHHKFQMENGHLGGDLFAIPFDCNDFDSVLVLTELGYDVQPVEGPDFFISNKTFQFNSRGVLFVDDATCFSSSSSSLSEAIDSSLSVPSDFSVFKDLGVYSDSGFVGGIFVSNGEVLDCECKGVVVAYGLNKSPFTKTTGVLKYALWRDPSGVNCAAIVFGGCGFICPIAVDWIFNDRVLASFDSKPKSFFYDFSFVENHIDKSVVKSYSGCSVKIPETILFAQKEIAMLEAALPLTQPSVPYAVPFSNPLSLPFVPPPGPVFVGIGFNSPDDVDNHVRGLFERPRQPYSNPPPSQSSTPRATISDAMDKMADNVFDQFVFDFGNKLSPLSHRLYSKLKLIEASDGNAIVSFRYPCGTINEVTLRSTTGLKGFIIDPQKLDDLGVDPDTWVSVFLNLFKHQLVPGILEAEKFGQVHHLLQTRIHYPHDKTKMIGSLSHACLRFFMSKCQGGVNVRADKCADARCPLRGLLPRSYLGKGSFDQSRSYHDKSNASVAMLRDYLQVLGITLKL